MRSRSVTLLAVPDAAQTVNREAVPKKHRIIHAPVGSTRGRLPQATYSATRKSEVKSQKSKVS
ncbi:hypothetical protein [Moorena sp. SIO3I6]|uniref:hypothetical protein n=1 Tax=Moorena sp. SIO3I6 TaxID=2607831 RepID=UPI0013FB7D80|nr:hypothetical protein [Moorena sp. SIO3I6]NEP23195.1 hypothetical protein [Moorena sp. SIO3I6]